MSKNTSISLGAYFDQFVKGRVLEGRFKNASEVIRAGLRLLEEEETRVQNLKAAIQEGRESGFVIDFDPDENLRNLKNLRKLNG